MSVDFAGFRWMRRPLRIPPVISGTRSRIREEVSSPYQRSLEPARRRMAYLL